MSEEQIKAWREEAMKLFSDNYLSSENIAPTSYLKGFLAAKTSSYERDGLIAEMKILKKENALLYRSYNKVCDEINRGEHLDFEWIRGIIQDEVTHPVIDASVKVVDSYRRKIDELKEELKREKEAVDFYANRKNWQTPESQGFKVDSFCLGVSDMIEEVDSRDSGCGGNKARQTQQQRKVEL